MFLGVVIGFLVMFRNQLFVRESFLVGAPQNTSDPSFGWKFPTSEFQPIAGRVRNIGAYSTLRKMGGIPRGLPVRLIIPEIKVNTAIEDALITADGRMDVPAGSVNVAWFSLGPQPGKVGSAVIGGHFGMQNGVPFVFYDLDKLKVGDVAYIVDDYGNTITFVAKAIKLYDRDADATAVFTSGDGKAHLNLITCEGIWNKVNDTYPQRRVVFMDLIPSQTSINNITSDISTTSSFGEFGFKGAELNFVSIAEFLQHLYQNPLDALLIIIALIFIIFVSSRAFKEKKVKVAKH